MTDETRRDDEEPKTEGTTPASAPAERMDLPKWSRARVKRAQPEAAAAAAPDAFQQGVREAGRTAVRRGPLVLGVIALIAGGVAGGIWWKGAREEKVAEGTRVLAQPLAWRARARIGDVDAYLKKSKRPPPYPFARDQAELDRNIDSAMAAVAASDSEQANTLALLVRGSTAMEKGDFAGAQTAYEQFIAKVGTGHDLSFAAMEGIALAKEAQGDREGAIAELDKLAGEVGAFYRDQALWHKARILEAMERKDEALEVFKQYATEYPLDKTSLARNEVRARLTELDPSLVPAEPNEAPPNLSGLLGP